MNDFIIIMKNTEAFLLASKEIELEVNAEKNKYMFWSREQKAVENRSVSSTFLKRWNSLDIWEQT